MGRIRTADQLVTHALLFPESVDYFITHVLLSHAENVRVRSASHPSTTAEEKYSRKGIVSEPFSGFELGFRLQNQKLGCRLPYLNSELLKT